MEKTLVWSAVLLGAFSGGCGGGGGGVGGITQSNSSSLSTPTPHSGPAPSQPFTIYQTTLSASSGANTYLGSYSETPNPGATMFDGQEANSSTVSLTITDNGSPIVSQIGTVYYLASPYQPLGETLSYNGGQFTLVYNSTDALPATLTVGGSGPLGTGTYFASNSNDAVGTLTESYAVASSPLGGTSILLIINATGTINGQPISEAISYVVNGEAAMGVASVDILLNGTTVHFDSSCNGCWDD